MTTPLTVFRLSGWVESDTQVSILCRVRHPSTWPLRVIQVKKNSVLYNIEHGAQVKTRIPGMNWDTTVIRPYHHPPHWGGARLICTILYGHTCVVVVCHHTGRGTTRTRKLPPHQPRSTSTLTLQLHEDPHLTAVQRLRLYSTWILTAPLDIPDNLGVLYLDDTVPHRV